VGSHSYPELLRLFVTYGPLLIVKINASPGHQGATSMVVKKSLIHVLKLHSLYWPPGGDSSGCIEAGYAQEYLGILRIYI